MVSAATMGRPVPRFSATARALAAASRCAYSTGGSPAKPGFVEIGGLHLGDEAGAGEQLQPARRRRSQD